MEQDPLQLMLINEAKRRGIYTPPTPTQEEPASPKSNDTILKKGARALSNILKTANSSVERAGNSMVASGDVTTGAVRLAGDVLGGAATVPLDIAAGIAPNAAAGVRDVAGRVLEKPMQAVEGALDQIPDPKAREYVSSVGSIAPDLIGAGAAQGAVNSLKRGASAVSNGASDVASNISKKFSSDVPPPPGGAAPPPPAAAAGILDNTPIGSAINSFADYVHPDPTLLKNSDGAKLTKLLGEIPGNTLEETLGDGKSGLTDIGSAKAYNEGVPSIIRSIPGLADVKSLDLPSFADATVRSLDNLSKQIASIVDSSGIYLQSSKELRDVLKRMKNKGDFNRLGKSQEAARVFDDISDEINKSLDIMDQAGQGVSLTDIYNQVGLLNRKIGDLRKSGDLSNPVLKMVEETKRAIENIAIKKLSKLDSNNTWGAEYKRLRGEQSNILKIRDQIEKEVRKQMGDDFWSEVERLAGDSGTTWAALTGSIPYFAGVLGTRLVFKGFGKKIRQSRLNSILNRSLEKVKAEAAPPNIETIQQGAPKAKGKLKGKAKFDPKKKPAAKKPAEDPKKKGVLKDKLKNKKK